MSELEMFRISENNEKHLSVTQTEKKTGPLVVTFGERYVSPKVMFLAQMQMNVFTKRVNAGSILHLKAFRKTQQEYDVTDVTFRRFINCFSYNTIP